jgi:prolipoprotein diacylglyceryltransferase
MTQPGSTIGRHPVELYAAALYLLSAGALAVLRKRRLAPGLAAASALIVAAAGRLVTEPLRPSLGGGPVWWYFTGIVAGLAALWLAWHEKPTPAPAREP